MGVETDCARKQGGTKTHTFGVFRVAIETCNPPLKIAFDLPDNGIYMVPRIVVGIQINFSSPKQSHTITSASTGNNKSICKTNPIFNFLHTLNF